MPLSDTTIKNAKTNPDKAYKLPDEKGMYLLVNPNGAREGLRMAKTLNKLSPLTIKIMVATAKREGRVTKAPDGGGLYFVAEPERSSWWHLITESTVNKKLYLLAFTQKYYYQMLEADELN